jgi:hypothetical protein
MVEMEGSSMRILVKCYLYLVAIVGVALSAAPADASLLWGTTHSQAENSLTSHLYTIDPTTGVTTSIGDTGFAINGLNYYNGTLYATEAGGSSRLLAINTATGAGSVIGSMGVLSGNRPVLLAIDATGNAFTWYDPGLDDLASVNLATGSAAVVGNSGLSTGAHGLAFLGNTLYLHNFDGSVYTINTITGAATFVGSTGTTAHHGDVNPDDNLYYGLSATGTGLRNLVRLDLTTQTVIGSVGLDRAIHSVAFQDDIAAVPEPVSLAIWGLGALGCAIGAYRRRKVA